jgi:hypothetical protein
MAGLEVRPDQRPMGPRHSLRAEQLEKLAADLYNEQKSLAEFVLGRAQVYALLAIAENGRPSEE